MLTSLRPAKIKFYIRHMEERGFTDQQVLAGTHISQTMLDDRYFLVELNKYIRIVNNINQLAGNSELAFDLGENLTLSDLGIMGYTVATSKNSKLATEIWNKYNPVFFGNLLVSKYQFDSTSEVTIHCPYDNILDNLLQFFIEEKINYDIAIARLNGIKKYPIEYVSLVYPKPLHVERYKKLLGITPIFSANENKLIFGDGAFSATSTRKTRDQETFEHNLKLLNDIFNYINSRSSHTHKIKALLINEPPIPHTIDSVADALCVSKRTLNRRLRDEGTTFAQLTAEAKIEKAENLLATTALSAEHIAEKVGFSDTQSFRRFFKNQTNVTVSQYRKTVIPLQNNRNQD